MKLDPSERRLVDQLLEALTLPEVDGSVLVSRWGLGDAEPLTLDELQVKFGLAPYDCRIRLRRAEKSFFRAVKAQSPTLLEKFFHQPDGQPRRLVVRFEVVRFETDEIPN